MSLFILCAFGALGLAALAESTSPSLPSTLSSPSNAGTSLTLIYQNNLNASDDTNHIGALILDPVSQASAAASACASFNEKLLPKSSLQKYSSDFINALAYQDFAGYFPQSSFYIQDGTVTVNKQLGFSASSPHLQSLPILCTQSANNGSSAAGPVNGSRITVTAQSNTFIGYRNQKSFRFLGIPYADTPKRWKYSSLYSPRNQTIDATAFGSQCAQGTFGSEDCLFLNIQTPYVPRAGEVKKKNLRPVMFWIHGGGFTGGTGSDPGNDGGNMASKEDLVVVSINYRLSTLGFLAIPGTDIKGNFGIGDQIVALDWVIENIAYFGGDPKRITIIGGSAGAGSVRALLGSPLAIGKFQGAVAVSNLGGGVTLGLSGDYGTTYSTYYTLNQSYTVAGPQIFTSANCTTGPLTSRIACLEKVPALQLVSYPTVARYVVQDGRIVNTPNLDLTHRGENTTAYVPVIFGTTRDDGASFSTYPKSPVSSHLQGLQVGLGINATWAQRIIDSGLFPLHSTGNLTYDSFNVTARVATDKTFRCIDTATVYAGATTHTFPRSYFYQFERTEGGYDPNNLGGPKDNNPENPYFRLHGAEMPWVFGTLGAQQIRDEQDLWSVQLVTSYFGAFVRGGDPNPDEGLLRARGYARVMEGVRKTGRWGEVKAKDGKDGEVRFFDWPGKKGSFVDVEQCEWLGYGLDYYLKGGA